MKILAVVRFNSGEAYVLDENPNLEYVKNGNTIVGTDGIFCNCYFFETPGPRWKAFAGREFDIQLKDGEIVKCNGQWWSGVTEKAVEILGEKPIHITAGFIDDLKKCYVFFGYTAIRSKIEELRKQYNGIVWDYWDYEATITNNKYRRKRGVRWLRKYRTKKRTLIFSNNKTSTT